MQKLGYFECLDNFVEQPIMKRAVRIVLFTAVLPIVVPFWLFTIALEWLAVDD